MNKTKRGQRKLYLDEGQVQKIFHSTSSGPQITQNPQTDYRGLAGDENSSRINNKHVI